MNVDFLIVGHGLAGATLAWQLQWLGQRVAVVDRATAASASRVAAGLITPITGQRSVVSHRYAEFLATALPFYRRVETHTAQQLLRHDRTLRKTDERELQDLAEAPTCRDYLGEVGELEAPYHQALAVELKGAARLRVGAFLDASRQYLQTKGRYFNQELRVDTDFVADSRIAVNVPCLGVSANRVLFCQGFAAASNHLFGSLPFEPAKGEVLELEAPSLQGAPTLLGDTWIVPTNNGRCLVGTTYERDYESPQPSTSTRRFLLSEFSKQTSAQCKALIGHRAAVRPIMRGRLPQFGISQEDTRFGFFNGLGSKGALRAPEAARQFAEYLANGEPVDAEFWYQATRKKGVARRLTSVAQAVIANAVSVGDVVIDATAGNGFDTLFLSKAVGEGGRVYAVDIQQDAISRTQAKLTSHDANNVHLLLASHANLGSLIPDEHHQHIGAVMFNLGYLPRGDQQRTTNATTTLSALQQSVKMLRPGEVVTVVAYTGHPGGLGETLAIEAWASSASVANEYVVQRPPTKITEGPPRLYVIQKT